MVLQLASVHLVLGIVGGVLVEVGKEDRLTVGGLDVFSGATVAVAAGANFVVEGAIYFVGFSAEDGCEVVRHFEEGSLSEKCEEVSPRSEDLGIALGSLFGLPSLREGAR